MSLMPFVFAGDEVCQSFAAEVQPLFSKLRANADESRTLAAIRDALLPKLMSGEVREA
jgi:type I restriction enzyme S subunit